MIEVKMLTDVNEGGYVVFTQIHEIVESKSFKDFKSAYEYKLYQESRVDGFLGKLLKEIRNDSSKGVKHHTESYNAN